MTKEQNNKQFNFFFYSFKIKIVLVIWSLYIGIYQNMPEYPPALLGG